MGAALLLLDRSSPCQYTHRPPPGLGAALPGLLHDLSDHLSSNTFCRELSAATCVSLSYAILLTPPLQGCDHHPVVPAVLVERAIAQAVTLSTEERLLLRQVLRVLELSPWNRCALKLAGSIVALGDPIAEANSCAPPAAFSHTANCHLVPALPVPTIAPSTLDCESAAMNEGPVPGLQGQKWQGIFVAHEIYRALEGMSSALSAVGMENRIVADSEAEAHILIPAHAVQCLVSRASSSSERDVALLWGSSVHYISGSKEIGKKGAEPQLTPSARFQVAWLHTMGGVEVIIVPNWWGKPCDSVEGYGQRLAAFIASGGQLSSAKPAATAASQMSFDCVE